MVPSSTFLEATHLFCWAKISKDLANFPVIYDCLASSQEGKFRIAAKLDISK
jgi:hypothetical protein